MGTSVSPWLRVAAAQHLHADTHVVAPGDTLNLIGSVYGVDVQTIQQVNGRGLLSFTFQLNLSRV
jgi:hypothetical protein